MTNPLLYKAGKLSLTSWLITCGAMLYGIYLPTYTI